jgi:hypothetical protein
VFEGSGSRPWLINPSTRAERRRRRGAGVLSRPLPAQVLHLIELPLSLSLLPPNSLRFHSKHPHLIWFGFPSTAGGAFNFARKWISTRGSAARPPVPREGCARTWRTRGRDSAAASGRRGSFVSYPLHGCLWKHYKISTSHIRTVFAPCTSMHIMRRQTSFTFLVYIYALVLSSTSHFIYSKQKR